MRMQTGITPARTAMRTGVEARCLIRAIFSSLYGWIRSQIVSIVVLTHSHARAIAPDNMTTQRCEGDMCRQKCAAAMTARSMLMKILIDRPERFSSLPDRHSGKITCITRATTPSQIFWISPAGPSLRVGRGSGTADSLGSPCEPSASLPDSLRLASLKVLILSLGAGLHKHGFRQE